LEKSKFFKKNQTSSPNSQQKILSYAQTFRSNINNIIKIKNTFPKLSPNKVSEIHNIMNKLSQKSKPKLKMTTKSLSRKQVIISIGSNNFERVMTKANAHVLNINRLLKKVKSDIYMDFIRSDNKELLITTNKVAVIFNLNIIKKYMKDSNDMDYSDIMSLRLF